MKKIITAILMGMAVMIGTDVMAGSACPKGQWLNGKKCAACPTGGKCDGKTMKCDTGNRWVQSGSKCVCQGYWKYKSSKDPNHCYACPKNATCNGGNGAKGIKCNKGFVLSGEQCVADKNAKGTATTSTGTCPKGQWMNGKKCAACPANATCDGKAIKCSKNFKMVGNQCLCVNGAFSCYGGRCACFACPKYAKCDAKGNWQCLEGRHPLRHRDDLKTGLFGLGGKKTRAPSCIRSNTNCYSGKIVNGKCY